MRSIVVALFIVFSASNLAFGEDPSVTVQMSPQIDLRYISANPQTERTVCVAVDATMAGGPVVADAVAENISARLTQGGFTIATAGGCFISLQVTIPQGVQAMVGYVDAEAIQNSNSSWALFGLERIPGLTEKKIEKRPPPCTFAGQVQIVVGKGTPAMVMVVAMTSPGKTPDEALPILEEKVAEGVAGIFIR